MILDFFVESEREVKELEIPKEYAWDFTKNEFIYENGKPVIVEKNEAIKIWVQKTLKTERYKYGIYTSQYGSELKSLIGRCENFIESEIERFIIEALMVNPYIKRVFDIKMQRCGRCITGSLKIETIYGEERINV